MVGFHLVELVGHCCVDGSPGFGEVGGFKLNCRSRRPVTAHSAFGRFRFPCCDLAELLAECGVVLDYGTALLWVWRYLYRAVD